MHREVFTTTRPQSLGTLLACDTSAECNLRCLPCVLDKRLRNEYRNPAKGLEKVGELTAGLVPFASKIQPYLTGEPFFREDVWQVLEQANDIAEERVLEVEVSTNALMLKGRLLDRVLRSCITSLLVTVNAGTEKTYKRICGGNFSLLKENLISLRESPLRKKRLTVSLSFVLMRENMEELPDFVRLAKEVGADAMQIWSLNNVAGGMAEKIGVGGFVFLYRQQMPKYYPVLAGKMLEQSLTLAAELGVRVGATPSYRIDENSVDDISYPLTGAEFTVLADKFDRMAKEESSDKDRIRKCYFPWNSIYYTTEGNFAPCLHLVYKGGFANIYREGIDGVWNGKIMQELRSSIMDGKIHELCRDAQCLFV
jgi:MoaA/NifB/PqqE/SkfB family radical SAM enzyme